jgi:hypothetical protein
MTARYLHGCGLFLGTELLGAAESNPYGHFEDLDVIGIHNDIFLANMTDWTQDRRMSPFVPEWVWGRMESYLERRQVAHRYWGFKDPRVCHFMGLWKGLVPDMKALIVYRSPAECVRSMNRRHAEDFARAKAAKRSRFYWEPDLALRIWTVSNAQLADFAERHPDDVLVVNHRRLAGGLRLSEMLNERWGTEFEPRDTRVDYDTALGSSSDRALRVADPENGRAARAVWERLTRIEREAGGGDMGGPGANGDGDGNGAQLRVHHDGDYGKILMENELLQFENAFIRRRLHEVNREARLDAEARAAHRRDRKALARKTRALKKARRDRDAVLASSSWKLTAPLRAATRRLRRLLGPSG